MCCVASMAAHCSQSHPLTCAAGRVTLSCAPAGAAAQPMGSGRGRAGRVGGLAGTRAVRASRRPRRAGTWRARRRRRRPGWRAVGHPALRIQALTRKLAGCFCGACALRRPGGCGFAALYCMQHSGILGLQSGVCSRARLQTRFSSHRAGASNASAYAHRAPPPTQPRRECLPATQARGPCRNPSRTRRACTPLPQQTKTHPRRRLFCVRRSARHGTANGRQQPPPAALQPSAEPPRRTARPAVRGPAP
jgi:hypothetical protein